MKKKDRTLKCECCRKEVKIVMGNQKYCNRCSLHSRNLRTKASYWRGVALKFRKIFYGQKDGVQRLR